MPPAHDVEHVGQHAVGGGVGAGDVLDEREARQRVRFVFDQIAAAHDRGQWVVEWHALRGHADAQRTPFITHGLADQLDAVGQGVPPNDAAAPITTREELKDYDPDLFELVDETMAYNGKVDWRYLSNSK